MNSEGSPASWTEDLPHCSDTGLGEAAATQYRPDGSRIMSHTKKLDYKVYCKFENNIYLYGIFTGHNGSQVAELSLQTIPYHIFCGQMQTGFTEDEIINLIKEAFVNVEKTYNDQINNLLFKRVTLLDSLPSGLSEYEIAQNYQQVLDELNNINEELTVGASVVLALIYNQKLYIANLGSSRALLCKNDDNNVLRVKQLSVDHDLTNPDEGSRFKSLGLDVKALEKNNAVYATRCIGNYMGKGGYKDSTFLSAAVTEPIITVPEIVGPIEINDTTRFLILMSKGLCRTLADIYDLESTLVNQKCVQITVEHFRSQTSLMGIAQSVVNKINLQHYEKFMEDKKKALSTREDMTFLIRNFNYPIPNAKNQATNKGTTTISSIMSDALNSTINSEYRTRFEEKIKPYVDFSDYYRRVEEAKRKGTLPNGIDFD